jgi:hypothetical protein
MGRIEARRKSVRLVALSPEQRAPVIALAERLARIAAPA